MNSQFTTVDLLLSPVFHKFPSCASALSEGGIGWMPYVLERVDYTWERHRWYTGVNPDVRPSDLFRDHIFGCFIADNAGIEERELIGVDNIMFEGDYPHSDSNFPASRKKLSDVLFEVPDDDARKIAEDNARSVFNFPRSSPADGTLSAPSRATASGPGRCTEVPGRCTEVPGRCTEEIVRQVGHDWEATTRLGRSGAPGRVGQGKHTEPTTETTK